MYYILVYFRSSFLQRGRGAHFLQNVGLFYFTMLRVFLYWYNGEEGDVPQAGETAEEEECTFFDVSLRNQWSVADKKYMETILLQDTTP